MRPEPFLIVCFAPATKSDCLASRDRDAQPVTPLQPSSSDEHHQGVAPMTPGASRVAHRGLSEWTPRAPRRPFARRRPAGHARLAAAVRDGNGHVRATEKKLHAPTVIPPRGARLLIMADDLLRPAAYAGRILESQSVGALSREQPKAVPQSFLIGNALWLDPPFPLSQRDVRVLLFELFWQVNTDRPPTRDRPKAAAATISP